MTPARQERKLRHLGPFLAAFFWGTMAVGAGLPLNSIELVITNRYTGLAIDGFDPVAYFVDAAPKQGRAELELRSAGATWRFQNEGNRAALAGAAGI